VADLVLEIVEGANAGQQVALAGVIEIGREAGAAIHLDDEQVSRRHARISPAGDHAVLEDLGSANGTYVNDQPAQPNQELRRGDDVRVGLTVIRLRSQDEVRREPSAIGPAPVMTVVLPEGVLRPAPPEELSSADIDVDFSSMPGLLVEESEPAFVPREFAVGDEDSGGGPRGPDDKYGKLASRVDARVKHRTNVAAIAFLAIAALVVLIWLGAS
jgi:pSer/pThr/pTyr-binding forkhead associated (FHA) protein